MLSLTRNPEFITYTTEELQIINKELSQSNATKDKFFSIISHDLRSPFNAMLGFSTQLIEGFDKYNTEKQKRFLGYIHIGIEQTFKLTEEQLAKEITFAFEIDEDKGHLAIKLNDELIFNEEAQEDDSRRRECRCRHNHPVARNKRPALR